MANAVGGCGDDRDQHKAWHVARNRAAGSWFWNGGGESHREVSIFPIFRVGLAKSFSILQLDWKIIPIGGNERCRSCRDCFKRHGGRARDAPERRGRGKPRPRIVDKDNWLRGGILGPYGKTGDDG